MRMTCWEGGLSKHLRRAKLVTSKTAEPTKEKIPGIAKDATGLNSTFVAASNRSFCPLSHLFTVPHFRFKVDPFFSFKI